MRKPNPKRGLQPHILQDVCQRLLFHRRHALELGHHDHAGRVRNAVITDLGGFSQQLLYARIFFFGGIFFYLLFHTLQIVLGGQLYNVIHPVQIPAALFYHEKAPVFRFAGCHQARMGGIYRLGSQILSCHRGNFVLKDADGPSGLHNSIKYCNILIVKRIFHAASPFNYLFFWTRGRFGCALYGRQRGTVR